MLRARRSILGDHQHVASIDEVQQGLKLLPAVGGGPALLLRTDFLAAGGLERGNLDVETLVVGRNPGIPVNSHIPIPSPAARGGFMSRWLHWLTITQLTGYSGCTAASLRSGDLYASAWNWEPCEKSEKFLQVV